MIIHSRVSKSKKRKISVKRQQEYAKWLNSIDIQTNFSKNSKKSAITATKNDHLLPEYRKTAEMTSRSDVVVLGPLTKSGIMKDYYKMSEADRQKIDDIAASTAPIHKSSYIYVSPGMNPASLGRKNEVL